VTLTATAKALADFAKDVEVLQLKTGMMDGEGWMLIALSF
jgi:ribosomal protein L10